MCTCGSLKQARRFQHVGWKALTRLSERDARNGIGARGGTSRGGQHAPRPRVACAAAQTNELFYDTAVSTRDDLREAIAEAVGDAPGSASLGKLCAENAACHARPATCRTSRALIWIKCHSIDAVLVRVTVAPLSTVQFAFLPTDQVLSRRGTAAAQADTALVFVSSRFAGQYERVVPMLLDYAPQLRNVVGCSAWGVIGTDARSNAPREVEVQPAVSITLIRFRDARADVFYAAADAAALPDADAPQHAWASALGTDPASPPTSFIVLVDPAFPNIEALLKGLDFAFPTAPVIGGLSSASTPAETRSLVRVRADCHWHLWERGRGDSTPAPVACGIRSSAGSAGERSLRRKGPARVPCGTSIVRPSRSGRWGWCCRGRRWSTPSSRRGAERWERTR